MVEEQIEKSSYNKHIYHLFNDWSTIKLFCHEVGCRTNQFHTSMKSLRNKGKN